MSPSPGLNLVTGETSSSSSQQTITPPSKRKRSRNGCTTCKLRKKKCDEEWAETTNSCKRCTLSGFDCDGESISQPVPKKRRPFVSSQIRSTAGSGSSGNETSGRPQEVSTAQATISTLDDEVETNSGENRDPVPVNDMADFSWQDTLFGHNSPQNNGMREGISTPVLQAFVDTLTNGFPALPNTSHNNFSRHPDPSNMANLIPSASSRNEMQADQYFLPLPFHLPSVGEKDVPNDGQTFTEGMKNPNTQIMHPRSARFDICK